jgi:hypothetical protein
VVRTVTSRSCGVCIASWRACGHSSASAPFNGLVDQRIASMDLDDLRLLAEWHEVSRKPFSYRQLEEFVPWAAFWQLDRHESNPMA